jgi:hypothetical protein
MRRRAARSTSPTTATTTTAPRVAWGRSSNRGVRNSRVRTTTRAVVMPASWLRAPLSRLTAVWDSPPPAGKAWKQPPARLAAPRARSSWSPSTRGSPGAVKARPAAIDSTNDIRASPAAGTSSSRAMLRSGAANWGRPGGMAPTRATPRSASPVKAASRIPRATTSRGAGQRRRRPAPSPEQEGDAGQGQDEGGPVDVAQVGQGRAELDEEVAVLLGDAQDLAELSGGRSAARCRP